MGRANVWETNVCHTMPRSLSDMRKKRLSLVIALFQVQAPYLNPFRQLRRRRKEKHPESLIS